MKYYYRLLLTILMLSMSVTPLAFSQNQSNFSYGVVYGSDTDIDKAQFEIQQLPLILPEYTNKNYLFKRRQWYASVVLFSNESDANIARSIIEKKYAPGSFVIPLKQWCRNDWINNTGNKKGLDFYDCKTGEILSGKTGAIIIAKFPKIEDARKKLEELNKDKFFKQQQYNLTIFKREDNYHTALINYADDTEANQKIPKIPKKGSYFAVDIKKWCFLGGNMTDNDRKTTKDGYIQCKLK